MSAHPCDHKIDWRKGQRNGLAKAQRAASEKRAQQRAECYADLGIDAMRDAALSYTAIAERLNEAGHVTTSGTALPDPVARLLSIREPGSGSGGVKIDFRYQLTDST